MKGDKLGVCVVGAGNMGRGHALCWQQVPEAHIVAVVDVIEARAHQLAELLELETWYTDYRPAVNREDVDVVSVCIPTCQHPEVTIYAAEQGKHVISEKPIALTLDDADAMIDAARRNSVKLAVGFMRRYSPVLGELGEWLASGALGRPVMYHSLDMRGLRPKREMHDARANGGPVIDMGVHLFDTWARAFGSLPVEVYAQGLTLCEGRPEIAHIQHLACDTATVQVRYASGDSGTFVVTWGLPPGLTVPDAPDHIFGPQGLAELEFAGGHQELRVLRQGEEWEVVSTCDENMYLREIQTFARCIIEDRPPPASGEQGRAALEVALAALESIRSGRPVSLPQ